MRLKKLLSRIMIGTIFILSNTMIASAATDEIKVVVNGNSVEFDTPPVANSSGRTMVPVSSIAKMLNAEVKWDGQKQQVTIVKGDIKLVLTIGSDIIDVNGEKIKMDAEAMTIGGRTMVPLSIIAKSFDANVAWNGSDKTVYITTEKELEVLNITSNSIDINYEFGIPKVHLAIANDEYASKIEGLTAKEFADFVANNEMVYHELFTAQFPILYIDGIFNEDTNYTIYIMEEYKNGSFSPISSEKFRTEKEFVNSEYLDLEYGFEEVHNGMALIHVVDKNNNKGFGGYFYFQEKDSAETTVPYIEAADVNIEFLASNGYPLSAQNTNSVVFGFPVTAGKVYDLYFVVIKDDLVSDIKYVEVKQQ